MNRLTAAVLTIDEIRALVDEFYLRPTRITCRGLESDYDIGLEIGKIKITPGVCSLIKFFSSRLRRFRLFLRKIAL